LVADVEEGEAESGGDARARHARASLVWNDGSEEDDVPLAFLGPASTNASARTTEAAGAMSWFRETNGNENAVTEANPRGAPRRLPTPGARFGSGEASSQLPRRSTSRRARGS